MISTQQYIAIAAIVAVYLLYMGWSNGWVGKALAMVNLDREPKPPSADQALTACRTLMAYLRNGNDSDGKEAITKIAERIVRMTL